MAYNVFKRPMFKRGGSTNGTGIMSHVEPKRVERVKAKTGFPFGNYSVGFPYEKSQFMSEPKTKMDLLPLPKPNIDIEFGPEKKSNYFEDTDFGKFLKETGINLKKIGAAGYDLTGVPMNVLSEFFTGKSAGFSGAEFFNVPGVDQDKTYFLGLELDKDSYKGDGKGITGAFPKGPPTGTVYPGSNKVIEEAAVNTVNEDNDDAKPDSIYEESDIRGGIEKEADLIKSLLKDEGLEKAELAFLVADALKTPGSIADKLETARIKGSKIAAGKRKQDREAMLLAYKGQKDKELAQIKANQDTGTQRTVKEFAELGLLVESGKATPTQKAIYQAYKDGIFKDEGGQIDSTVAALVLTFAQDTEKYVELIQDINKKEAEALKVQKEGKDLSSKKKAELEALRKQKSIIDSVLEAGGLGEYYGLKEGGRVMKQIGGAATEEPQIEAKETAGEGNIFPTKPVEKLSFEQLRDRLPQEITNDIVQLLANSVDALQDFAYIRTQQDINDFNIKYGVNLILPPEKSV